MIARKWTYPALAILAGAAGCATLQQIAALRQVDFSLAGTRNARLAGVDLSRVRSYRDLSAVDLGRIGLAVARKDLPLEFQLDVRGENPAANSVTATSSRCGAAGAHQTKNGFLDLAWSRTMSGMSARLPSTGSTTGSEAPLPMKPATR